MKVFSKYAIIQIAFEISNLYMQQLIKNKTLKKNNPWQQEKLDNKLKSIQWKNKVSNLSFSITMTLARLKMKRLTIIQSLIQLKWISISFNNLEGTDKIILLAQLKKFKINQKQ